MKFYVTAIETIPTRFGAYKEYYLQSKCERFTKVSSNYRNLEVGDEVNTFHTHPLTRLKRRLNSIGIDIELKGNIPWIYLVEVNGVKVTETLGANHGFCVGYSESVKLSNRKSLFRKIRECLGDVMEVVEEA